MGSCISVKNFAGYPISEFSTTEYKTIKLHSGSEMLVMRSGLTPQTCLSCSHIKQLWNVKYIHGIKQFSLTKICSKCIFWGGWGYIDQNTIYIGRGDEIIKGKVEIKQDEKNHFQCQGCKNYLHTIYNVIFDEKFNYYPKILHQKHCLRHSDRHITKRINSHCLSCLKRLGWYHIQIRRTDDYDW